MIIVMASRKPEDIQYVVSRVEELGYKAHLIQGVERTVIAAVGDERGKFRLQSLDSLPHVEKVVPILRPFKLASREARQEDTIITIDKAEIGGKRFCIMAGPCSVESRDQLLETAKAVHESGAVILRGGAFKPRTSPYAFQGLEEEGLRLLEEAGKAYDMPFVTEVMTPEQVPLIEKYADMLQIGARNMQNFGLLKAVGKSSRPVLLKRGMMSTINELLMSAEYILSEGNKNVVLCERGIRTFETETRNTLDLSAVPALKAQTHLPVIVDPSHGTGKWELVTPMAKAALAVGADGLMIEVHPRPAEAFSDGQQSLTPAHFQAMMDELQTLLPIMGKTL